MEIVIELPLSEPKSQLLASVTSKNAASTTTKMRRKEVTRAILSIERTELTSWEKVYEEVGSGWCGSFSRPMKTW
jgi:hypothetical protein